MIKIAFVITGLGVGGAETMLVRLLARIDRTKFDPFVISLARPGELSEQLQALGIPIHSLNLSPGTWSVRALASLVGFLRRIQPNVIQGWMYHGNLAAQLASFVLPRRIPVVWNIRGTIVDLERETISTALTVRLGAFLAHRAHTIVNNSAVSARLHRTKLGYPEDNVIVIPNGFDTELFKPDPSARKMLRESLGLEPGALVLGHVGRLHPMKNHEALLEAAAKLMGEFGSVHVVWIGADVDGRSVSLLERAHGLGLGRNVHYLGQRRDVHRVMPGFDILVLASAYGEGFPNVLGEAMACGVPCVATDVGDSAQLVGNCGLIVPPRDQMALVHACRQLLAMPEDERLRLGDSARRRILENYSLGAITRRYEELYLRVSSARR